MTHTDKKNGIPDKKITMAIVTEQDTQIFQLGETVREAIAQAKLALLPHLANSMPKPIDGAIDDIDTVADIPHVELTLITNSEYLSKWCDGHGHNTTLVDDEGIIDTIKNDAANMVIVVPAAQHIAIHPNEGIAIVPNEGNVIVNAQEELLRLDDHDKRVHNDALIALMLPPEYRVIQSSIDPDTYIRVIATPSYINMSENKNGQNNTPTSNETDEDA